MTIVSISQGRIEGEQRGSALAFLGIPYAAPPVGPLRFHAPGPAHAWQGTRSSLAGFAAPQSDHPIPGFASSGPRDEDCLYLNVFTPAADSGHRPVLFWIHGGGFTHGASTEALYDGAPLAERGDVVVISINYRLGALGFLSLESHLPDRGLSANNGILDAVAALNWTRENVEAFGGDPANITIFGESAGAAAVGTLLAMPAARGLFRRAILQSGTGRAATPQRASQIVDAMLSALGLDRSSADQLLTLPAEQIVAAQSSVSATADRNAGPIFGPVIDPATLPDQPRTAIANGAAADIPILVGTNRDEVKLFAASMRREPIDTGELLRQVAASLPNATTDQVAALVEVYRQSRNARRLPTDNLDILDAVRTDVGMRISAMNLAISQRKHNPHAYIYLFTHESPARHGALGSCHALEMPFVFGTFSKPGQARFAGEGPEVERLASEMMDAWLAFARSDSPAHEGIGAWSAYNSESRPTMVFGHPSRLEDDPFGEERRAVEALL